MSLDRIPQAQPMVSRKERRVRWFATSNLKALGCEFTRLATRNPDFCGGLNISVKCCTTTLVEDLIRYLPPSYCTKLVVVVCGCTLGIEYIRTYQLIII